MTDAGPYTGPFDIVFYPGTRAQADQWARDHHIPVQRVVSASQSDYNNLRGWNSALIIGWREDLPADVRAVLSIIPIRVPWDGESNVSLRLGITTRVLKYAHIEVCPETGGGWKVTEYSGKASDPVPHLLTRTRTKRTAMLIGRGAALVLACELRVKNRAGRYTTEGASYGATR